MGNYNSPSKQSTLQIPYGATGFPSSCTSQRGTYRAPRAEHLARAELSRWVTFAPHKDFTAEAAPTASSYDKRRRAQPPASSAPILPQPYPTDMSLVLPHPPGLTSGGLPQDPLQGSLLLLPANPPNLISTQAPVTLLNNNNNDNESLLQPTTSTLRLLPPCPGAHPPPPPSPRSPCGARRART